MQIGTAGTMESSDVFVTIKPVEQKGLSIQIQSTVFTTFGDQIRQTVEEVLSVFEIEDAEILLVDKGAIDCVIRARMEAALCRATGSKFDWKGENKNV